MVFISNQPGFQSGAEYWSKNLLITQETKYLNVVYVPLAPELAMMHTYDFTKRELAEETLHESEHIIVCSSKNPPSDLSFAEGLYES